MTEPPEMRAMKKYAAECVGTFILLFGGVGCAVLAGPRVGNAGVAFAFGLSLLAMVYAIGPISGCHINPAVTLGLYLARKVRGADVPGYVIAQVLGAILASAAILAIARDPSPPTDILSGGFGANGFGAHSPAGFGLLAALLAETILTAILVFTVLGSTDVLAPVGFAGIPIGLVLTLIHLVGIPITNTSVNPARSIGPALFVGGWALSQLWVFIVAPCAGAALAALLYRAIGRRGPVADEQQLPPV